LVAHTLTISCADRRGIVAAVTTLLFNSGGNILEAQQFDDQASKHFFMRVVFELENDARDISMFQSAFEPLASQYGMKWNVRSNEDRRRVMLLVSKFDHCLGDLLYRHRIGELPMEIVGIISNHPKEALKLNLIGDIAYHHLPVSKDTKPQQEAAIRELIEASNTDLVVLARYMQVLSTEMCGYLSGFKGAGPYQQAHDRGVKVIGATAHFVTADLDEGPIICQDIEHVTHADTAQDFVRKGRDIERRVLARAVHYYLDDRILMNGDKTVIFNS
jgi:formyltetrahydrofolate deformylase